MPTIDSISSEPIIRVGIILPDDKRRSIKINIPKNNESRNNNIVSGELNINIYEDKVSLNDKVYEKIDLNPENKSDQLLIKSVPAGRCFHWQKDIDVIINGSVTIKNENGYLTLINELSLEQYLKCVATAEMSPDCPPALLEAQIISARSWLLANRNVNHPNSDFDVCNDDCCQRYQGIIELAKIVEKALLDTKGKVLTYNNEICDARYSKCCGGITESFENVWSGKPKQYLSSIVDSPNSKNDIDLNILIKSEPDSYCSSLFVKPDDLDKYLGRVDFRADYFRWKIEYSSDRLIAILKDKLKINIEQLIDLIPLERGFSGRITKLQIKYVDSNNDIRSIVIRSEYAIRRALHEKFLYSSAFLLDKQINEKQLISTVKLLGAGWGHGVGLCQIGALGMALSGISTKDILQHYYSGAEINKIY